MHASPKFTRASVATMDGQVESRFKNYDESDMNQPLSQWAFFPQTLSGEPPEILRSREVRRLHRAVPSLQSPRVMAERGEIQQAIDLLSPVYRGFTEVFDTPDLKEAKALLQELRV
jgi:hypothetical protein